MKAVSSRHPVSSTPYSADSCGVVYAVHLNEVRSLAGRDFTAVGQSYNLRWCLAHGPNCSWKIVARYHLRKAQGRDQKHTRTGYGFQPLTIGCTRPHGDDADFREVN
jgi:hypothetical protein